MSRQIAAGEAVADAAPRYTQKHDSLTWLVPTGHLHGPKKASTRYLGSVTRQSVDKTATLLDLTTPALVGQTFPVKRSLNKGLCRMFNRHRNLVILMAHRTLDVLLDSTVNETAVEQFTIKQGSQGAPTFSHGHCLLVNVGGRGMKRVLDAKSTAAHLVAEFFSIDSGEVRKSVAVGGAQFILNYMEDDKLLKLLRSESEETRKGGFHILEQEMEDQIAGDADLSEPDPDENYILIHGSFSLWLIPEFCPRGQRHRLPLNESTLLV